MDALELHGPEPVVVVFNLPRGLIRTREYHVLESNVLEWRARSDVDTIFLRGRSPTAPPPPRSSNGSDDGVQQTLIP